MVKVPDLRNTWQVQMDTYISRNTLTKQNIFYQTENISSSYKMGNRGEPKIFQHLHKYSKIESLI